MPLMAGRKLRHSTLTESETRVMTELAKGLSRKMIADQLGVSQPTVGFHLKNVYRKWRVNNMAGAITIFIESK
jgi:DNA-binding NarL/FixJ family response regulator